jgi:hypothetical protein
MDTTSSAKATAVRRSHEAKADGTMVTMTSKKEEFHRVHRVIVPIVVKSRQPVRLSV